MLAETRESKNNHTYQREMAISLINELGYDAAVSVCCEHGWEGTLEQLMHMHPEDQRISH